MLTFHLSEGNQNVTLSACLEVVPEVYSGKLFSPGKTGILEPHFGYLFIRPDSAEMYSKTSLARTPNMQFSLLKHHLQTSTKRNTSSECIKLKKHVL